MATAADAIAHIRKFEGRRDNRGLFIWDLIMSVYGFASFYRGAAYCGATQLEACHALGLSTAPMRDPKRLVYVPYVVQDAKAAGKWRISKQSKPGDWCINDWSPSDGVGDHITMVLRNDPSSEYITVIGGNHGDGKTSGARGVFVRTWHRSQVMGTVNRQDAYSATAPAHDVAAAAGVLLKGSVSAQVKTLQAGLLRVFPSYAGPIKTSGGADGRFGDGTVAVVKEYQRRSGLVADGVVGPATTAALAKNGIKL